MTSGLVAQTRARPVHDTASADQPWPTGTFSILAYDPATGEIGAAVQSRVFSVGNGVLWAEAGVGAAATQAIVDVSYGPQALELLRQGLDARRGREDDLGTRPRSATADWSKEGRQFAVIDAKGNVFAYTGPKATDWAGHKSCTARTQSAPRRETSSPARRSSTAWSRSSSARPGICRIDCSPRSKAGSSPAATSADNSRPPWSS